MKGVPFLSEMVYKRVYTNLYNFFSSISLPAPRQNQLAQRVTYCNTGQVYEQRSMKSLHFL